jgi:hypothetical protein
MGLGEYRWKNRQHMNRNGLVIIYFRMKGEGSVVLAVIKYFTLRAHGGIEV